MRIAFALLSVCTAFMAAPAVAQTLNVRPAPLADLRDGRQPRYGEVVLGRTTMAGALRMFAEELSSDSLKVARVHPGNPAPVPTGTVWAAAGQEVRPRQQLDLGPERYTLYFDENERLIAAGTGRLPGGLTLKVLNKHYPALQKGQRWYSGHHPLSGTWSVAVDRCVTLVADVLVKGQKVQSLSYIYNCPTTSTGASRTSSR